MPRSILLGGLALCASACASFPRPQQRLETSLGQLTAAEAVGAQRVPRAALHLEYARDEVTQAQKFLEANDNERADHMLCRAQADAKLAVILGQNQAIFDKTADAKAELQRVQASYGADQ